MTPRELIKLPKTIVEAGAWKRVTGKSHMPATAFPMSGRHGVQLARGYHWRVDQLAAGATSMRLLTAFEPTLEEYRAWLSVDAPAGIVLAAMLEFHGDHPGWHCHAACCDIDDLDAGEVHSRQCVRLPGGNSEHRREEFDCTSQSALIRSFEFFRVHASASGLDL